MMCRVVTGLLLVGGGALIVWDASVAAVALMGIIGVLAVTFVAVYARRDWRATAAGRALMALMCLWAALALYVWVTLGLGTYPHPEWLRAVLYLVGAVTMWRMVATMLHAR